MRYFGNVWLFWAFKKYLHRQLFKINTINALNNIQNSNIQKLLFIYIPTYIIKLYLPLSYILYFNSEVCDILM